MHAFETLLVSNLQARTNLSGVTVTDGPPTSGAMAMREFMYVGNATGTQSYKTFGDNYTDSKAEEYTFTFYIDAYRAWGQDQSLATDRAFELFTELEDEIRLNQNAYRANSVYLVQVAGPISLQKYLSPDSQWRLSRLIVGIKVSARI